jgi:chromosome segregation ATPase
MSVVEDVRQVLQDFLAPELRALTGRIDSVDIKLTSLDAKVANLDAKVANLDTRISGVEIRFSGLDARVSGLEKRMDTQFNEVEQRAALRQDILVGKFDYLEKLLNLDYRMARLERQQPELPPKSA